VVAAADAKMNCHPEERAMRSELGFVDSVRAAFRFLVEDYGFRLARSEDPTFVRYESDTMFLNVYHGRRSYELNVEVGFIADPFQRAYRLADVLGAILGSDHKGRTYFQASGREAVFRCVQGMAELVSQHYGAVLRGDARALGRIAAHTSETSRGHTRAVVQRPVREAAERAWHAKNYVKVEELYKSIRDSLTVVERRRLEYAEKHRRRDD
jgi:hypothetical protein